MAIGTTVIDLSQVKKGDFLRVESGHQFKIDSVVQQDDQFLVGLIWESGTITAMRYDQKGKVTGADCHRNQWNVIYQTVLNPEINPNAGEIKRFEIEFFEYGNKLFFNAGAELDMQIDDHTCFRMAIMRFGRTAIRIMSDMDVSEILRLDAEGYSCEQIKKIADVVFVLENFNWYQAQQWVGDHAEFNIDLGNEDTEGDRALLLTASKHYFGKHGCANDKAYAKGLLELAKAAGSTNAALVEAHWQANA